MPKPPFARPDGGLACDDTSFYILLVLPRYEFDRAPKARGVPRRKQCSGVVVFLA
jgi:hypothetical protein